MKIFSFVAVRLSLIFLSVAVTLHAGSTQAEEKLHGEALLVWGTDEPHSPDPKHIPVDAELARKLSHSPYRWKYYFEVKRQLLEIPTGQMKSHIVMSDHCVLDVKNLGTNWIQVKLYGDGKPVSSNKEPFKDNWPLIFAGSAGNETAWLVVLRKTKPIEAGLEKTIAK